MNEFELISRYFTRPGRRAVLGVGDDCALIAPTTGHELALSTDMLVEGRHFLKGTDPEALGHKTLAVNISDCAAVGARPRYALLAGALPAADERWLAAFSRGLFALADRYDVELIGGDTTRGPLNLCVTIVGEVPAGQALLRSGAQHGDWIWVSGELGSAALGLAALRDEVEVTSPQREEAIRALECPTPRVELGIALRGVATSAIDISDGVVGDLGHILERSNKGAEIDIAHVPCSGWLRARLADPSTRESALSWILAGGDDYELCFTAPAAFADRVIDAGTSTGVSVSPIGRIREARGLVIHDERGHALNPHSLRSFDHFR